MVIPSLFEAEMTGPCDGDVWVVRCVPAEQLQRLMQRSHLTLEQAQVRVVSQMPIEQKLLKQTVVLDNHLQRRWLFSTSEGFMAIRAHTV